MTFNYDIDFTDEQRSAIEAKSGVGLIVSAAAGSGKTAVLTTRIIRRICCENADISRIVALTFTRAAANQLRDKIIVALNKQLANDPGNARLRRQKLLLGRAKIMTTDSFILSIVRDRHTLIDYPSDFRLIDEKENDSIENSVMSKLIDDCFEAADGKVSEECTITGFRTLYSVFGDYKKQNAAAGSLLVLYRELENKYDFLNVLLRNRTEEKEEPGELWSGFIRERIARFVDHYRPIVDDAKAYCDSNKNSRLNANCGTMIDSAAELLEKLSAALNDGSGYGVFADAVGAFADVHGTESPSGKAAGLTEYDDRSLFYKKEIVSFFSRAAKFADDFCFSGEEIKNASEFHNRFIDALYGFFTEFDKRLREEKRLRRVMYFTDVSRYACEILYNRDGTLSDTANAIRNSYDEVYIDEYQDTNEIQEKVFSAIAEEKRLFRVGDIKQSVYEFRGAVPEIMTDRLAGCEKYRRDTAAVSAKIFLSANFRSEAPIIDFTNSVFDTLMRHSKTVRYEDDDRLCCMAKKTGDAGCEVLLFPKQEAAESEPVYVARRIREMVGNGTIDGKKINYSDIAILLRTEKGVSEKYIKALDEAGVPCRNAVSDNLLQSPDVVLTLCLLNVIDDPDNDIYLAGLMMSPLYGFTADELYGIRSSAEGGSLYSALVAYTGNSGCEKGKRLIGDTERYRRKARTMPCDEFLWYICGVYGIFNFAADGDSHLRGLYECARRFGQSGYKGLDDFVRFLQESAESEDGLLSDIAEKSGTDAVSVMTIHHSKGLEFPVCFICETGREMKKNDDPFKLAPCFGFAPQMPDESGLKRSDTLFSSVTRRERIMRSTEENMRILYVAMTRAMSKLIVTATVDSPDRYLKMIRAAKDYRSEFMMNTSKSFLDWILLSSDVVCDEDLSDEGRIKLVVDPGAAREERQREQSGPTEAEAYDYAGLAEERLSFKYRNKSLSSLPLKLAVSDLYPTVLDAGAGGGADESPRSKEYYYKPAFIREAEGYKMTPAELGTALHVFMQFCDFTLVEKNGVEAERDRLLALGFLSAAQAESIPADKVRAFFESGLYRRMKNAAEMYREKRFIVGIPAAELTGDDLKKQDFGDETVIVQGVIDCAFVDSDGRFCLVDYKTDRFRGDMPEEEIRKTLAERHGLQLGYYRRALEIMYGRKPDETLIYSFALSNTVAID